MKFTSDPFKHTALHIATANDDPEMVRKLLRHPNTDLNPISKIGLTPLMLALKRGKSKALQVFFTL
jgi:ankyrin repeat protein